MRPGCPFVQRGRHGRALRFPGTVRRLQSNPARTCESLLRGPHSSEQGPNPFRPEMLRRASSGGCQVRVRSSIGTAPEPAHQGTDEDPVNPMVSYDRSRAHAIPDELGWGRHNCARRRDRSKYLRSRTSYGVPRGNPRPPAAHRDGCLTARNPALRASPPRIVGEPSRTGLTRVR